MFQGRPSAHMTKPVWRAEVAESQTNHRERGSFVVGPSRYQVLPGRYQVGPGTRYQPRAPVHQMAGSTGVTPCSRSPGDQVGRVYSRAPGDLVNGATVLDTLSLIHI